MSNPVEKEQPQWRPFDPQEHMMMLPGKNKEYLEVKWRIVWFRSLCPHGTIETQEVVVDLDRDVQEESMVWNPDKKRKELVVKKAQGYARFYARVADGRGGVATGTKSENAASFPDYIEKAETGAIGRALAMLGYGTQSVGEELSEGHRIVDSGVEVPTTEETPVTMTTTSTSSSSSKTSPVPATKPKVTPAMPLTAVPTVTKPQEERQPVDWRATILGYKDECDPLEWELVCELAKLPERPEEWTPENAFQVTAVAEAWCKAPITAEQQADIMTFRSKYGKALSMLKASIQGIADVTTIEGLMRSQAEVLLRLVREADAVLYPNGKQVDKDLKIARSVDPTIAHPLLFVCPNRTIDQKSLYDYDSALKAHAEDAEKAAASPAA